MSAANHEELQQIIAAAWERRAELSPATTGADRDAVEAVLGLLDAGRVARGGTGGRWLGGNQWLKQAVLLSFRLDRNAPMGGAGGAPVFDKVPMKFAGWGADASPRQACARCRARWCGVRRISRRAWC